MSADSPKIFVESNYRLFIYNNLNRPVERHKQKYKDLKESMSLWGWFPDEPIAVLRNPRFVPKKGAARRNEFIIHQGHHRFTAAKELGLPIHYVVLPKNHPTIQEREYQKKSVRWTLQQFIAGHAGEGKESYLNIQAYAERTGITVNQAAAMFFGRPAGRLGVVQKELLESGCFRMNGTSHPYEVEDMINIIKAGGFAAYNHAGFVSALSLVMLTPAVDNARLANKLRAHTYLLEKQPDKAHYLANIEVVYNRQTPESGKLALVLEVRKYQATIKP